MGVGDMEGGKRLGFSGLRVSPPVEEKWRGVASGGHRLLKGVGLRVDRKGLGFRC